MILNYWSTHLARSLTKSHCLEEKIWIIQSWQKSMERSAFESAKEKYCSSERPVKQNLVYNAINSWIKHKSSRKGIHTKLAKNKLTKSNPKNLCNTKLRLRYYRKSCVMLITKHSLMNTKARGLKLEKQNTYKHIPNWSEAWQYVDIFSNFFSEIERKVRTSKLRRGWRENRPPTSGSEKAQAHSSAVLFRV